MSKSNSYDKKGNKERKGGGGVSSYLPQLSTLSMLMDVVRLALFDNILTILQHYVDTKHSELVNFIKKSYYGLNSLCLDVVTR